MSNEKLNYLGHRPWWGFWLNLISAIFWLIVALAFGGFLNPANFLILGAMYFSWQGIEILVGHWQERNPLPDNRSPS